MTTQPVPTPEQTYTLDILPPQDRAYADRLTGALRCGVPGCECADGPMVHCPSHSHAEVPTLTISYDSDRGFSFQCLVCSPFRIKDALAKRGLAPEGEFYTAFGAQEAGLQPFNFLIQQPQDWLWPNRIPPRQAHPHRRLPFVRQDLHRPGHRRPRLPGRSRPRSAGRPVPFRSRRPRAAQRQPEGRYPPHAPPLRCRPRPCLPCRPPLAYAPRRLLPQRPARRR